MKPNLKTLVSCGFFTIYTKYVIGGSGGVVLLFWYRERNSVKVIDNYAWISIVMMALLPMVGFMIALTGVRTITKLPISTKFLLSNGNKKISQKHNDEQELVKQTSAILE